VEPPASVTVLEQHIISPFFNVCGVSAKRLQKGLDSTRFDHPQTNRRSL
jgi:hypothetical protein